MPAVQKSWKPFVPQGTKSQEYYTAVSASDKAFGLFLFQYYKPTTGKQKLDNTEEEDEAEKNMEQGDACGDGDAEPEVAVKKKKQ